VSQISDLIVTRLVEKLSQELITKISSGDPSRAGEVQAYRFQDNPLNPVNFVWVSAGNPNDPDYRDGRVTADQMEDLGMTLPAGEIGGGHYWWRRGRVSLGCYYILKSFKQDVAAKHAHTFLGRVTYHTEHTNVADLVDEWGERAYYLWVPHSTFFEGGGPPAQYIWRGEVAWQALTHRP
jgi:hypothetical protein